MIEIDFSFWKKPKIPDNLPKPPKRNPQHIRPPQIENPIQKPHRAPERRPTKK